METEYYIARDYYGSLYLLDNVPIRHKYGFTPHYIPGINNGIMLPIDKEKFPEVTWENSPKRIKIELVDM